MYELPPTQYCNLGYCGNGAQGKCGLTLITVGLSLKLLIYLKVNVRSCKKYKIRILRKF